MKQNKFFILAAALAFVACSSDDNYTAKEKASQAPQEVSFSAYVNRGVTRAGYAGAAIANTGSPTAASLSTVGFGVFAYYTDADFYDQTFTPNFMYNQKVSGTTWTYSPLKYWPNEFGSNSASDDIDKVSFFAYAPYVTVEPTTGKVKAPTSSELGDDGDNTYGIVAVKKNNATGDPMVKYITTFYTDKQVDLLWGTVASTSETWALKQSDNQSLTAGLPWLDVEHPKGTATDQKVKFDFKHALASLNVTVDTYADKATGTPTHETSGQSPDTKTKVFIRSVTFEGFDTKAALNLNNTKENTALWFTFDCCCEELSKGAETTIQDGRKDGKEGLTKDTKEYAAINPNFVQDNVWESTKTGVTGTAANLFCTSASATPGVAAPIYVIPNNDPLKVTIEYDVLTADDKLAGKLNDGTTHGSVVKNVITRYITTGEIGSTASTEAMILNNGKQYTIKLHLGLNSVEFEASVTDWDDAIEGGADLPHNN